MSSALARVPWLGRWIVVMALAVGVMVMHHVVSAHAHVGGSGHRPAAMTMPVTQVDSCCGAAPASVAVAAGPAQPGETGLMLHPCLAVLTGLILVAALVLTRRPAQVPGLGPSGGGLRRRASQPRAPPLPLRLAQLGVLRR